MRLLTQQDLKWTKNHAYKVEHYHHSYNGIPICRILTFQETDNAFAQLLKTKGDANLAGQACLDLGSVLQTGPSSRAWGKVYP